MIRAFRSRAHQVAAQSFRQGSRLPRFSARPGNLVQFIALNSRCLPRVLPVVGPCSHNKAELQLNCEHQNTYRDQHNASSVLRAASEYISRVKPLKMRLIPRIVPMAHAELDGQGSPIRPANNSATMASKRIHPEPS